MQNINKSKQKERKYEMDKQIANSLKNYISSVIVLEKNKYELETSIENLHKHIAVPNIVEPIEIDEKIPSRTGGILGLLVGIVLLIYGIFSHNFGLTLLFGGAGLILIAIMKSTLSDIEKTIDKIAKDVKRNAEINYKNERIKANVQKSNLLINASISQYDNALTSVKNTLNTYYSKNLIHPKYRNLTALMYIFEYFDTGRATTMVEAYNFYEEEFRLDKIISQITVVIENLNTIIDNQFDIMQSVKESTKKIQETSNMLIAKAHEISENQVKITESLDSIDENIEITKKAALIIEANQYYERNWTNMRGAYDRAANLN